ncbi:MAG: tyrosine-type recombinase/integrase [Dehalococcoidales bacterium]
MRGHIVKRYKNSYTIVLNLGIDPATGKRKQQWVSVKGTKKEAEQRLSDLLHQLDTGTFMKPGKTTLASFMERWLADSVFPNLAPRTAEVYEYITRVHLVPALGHVPLTQLKPAAIQKYYSEKLSHGRHDGKGGLSAKSVRHHHMTLHCALETAVKWGLLQRNPADSVQPPHAEKAEMKIWEEDEIKKFLDSIKDSSYYPLFFLSLFTGLRRSELLAIRWQEVDFIYCQLYISRSIHQLRNGQFVYKSTKSARGNRPVALSPATLDVLGKHQTSREAQCLLLDRKLLDSELVFCHVDGSPLVPDTVSAAWGRAIRRSGLKVIRFHDARHSHASLLLKQGVHPKVVQERLGHSSIQVTLDTYSHVVPGMQQMAASRLDDIFKTPADGHASQKVG